MSRRRLLSSAHSPAVPYANISQFRNRPHFTEFVAELGRFQRNKRESELSFTLPLRPIAYDYAETAANNCQHFDPENWIVRCVRYFIRYVKGPAATQWKRELKDAITATGAVETGTLRRGVKVKPVAPGWSYQPAGSFDLLPFFPAGPDGTAYGFIVNRIQIRQGGFGFIRRSRIAFNNSSQLDYIIAKALDRAIDWSTPRHIFIYQ